MIQPEDNVLSNTIKEFFKRIDFKAMIKEQWVFILLIVTAFVVGYFIGVVKWNVICQNMYDSAVQNLSCIGVYGPKLIDYGINMSVG